MAESEAMIVKAATLLRPLLVTALLTLSALLPAACDDGAAPPDRTLVRDSAGIEIVVSRAPRWEAGEAWRVGEEPVLSIGEGRGGAPYRFVRISDAARHPSGGVVVADIGASELRFYDAGGGHLGTVGGEGEGPGEFARLLRIAVDPGGAVTAFDDALSRLTRFRADRTLAWTRRLPPIPAGDGEARVGDVRRLSGDTVIALDGRNLVRGGEGVVRDTAHWAVVDPESGSTRPLTSTPGMTTEVVSFRGNPGYRLVPLTPAPSWDVHHRRLHLTPGDRFEIRVVDPSGRVERIVREDRQLRPVTEGHVRAWKERRLEGAPEEQRSRMRTLLDGLTFPERLPTYSALLVDPEGCIWAERRRAPGSESAPRWAAFSPGGELLGEVTMPAGLRVLEIGSDHVLGVRRGELGVERVEVRRLFREGPG